MRRLVLTPVNALRHVAWYLSYHAGDRRSDGSDR
jgi:hypothetical protein